MVLPWGTAAFAEAEGSYLRILGYQGFWLLRARLDHPA